MLLGFTGSANRRCSEADAMTARNSSRSFMAELVRAPKPGLGQSPVWFRAAPAARRRRSNGRARIAWLLVPHLLR